MLVGSCAARERMLQAMAYKERTDREREAVLDELVADAQENAMGDDRL
jgi:hypothetical protein